VFACACVFAHVCVSFVRVCVFVRARVCACVGGRVSAHVCYAARYLIYHHPHCNSAPFSSRDQRVCLGASECLFARMCVCVCVCVSVCTRSPLASMMTKSGGKSMSMREKLSCRRSRCTHRYARGACVCARVCVCFIRTHMCVCVCICVYARVNACVSLFARAYLSTCQDHGARAYLLIVQLFMQPVRV